MRKLLLNMNIYLKPVIVIILLLAVFWMIKNKLRKSKRKGLSNDFLCDKRRSLIVDAVDSFYISNPKVGFTVTVSDLVARGLIDENNATCPGKGAFTLLLKRSQNGHLFDATLTCSVHGISSFSE